MTILLVSSDGKAPGAIEGDADGGGEASSALPACPHVMTA
jgi:hypothetical protein